jgi:class 3 adenylate cyclase
MSILTKELRSESGPYIAGCSSLARLGEEAYYEGNKALTLLDGRSESRDNIVSPAHVALIREILGQLRERVIDRLTADDVLHSEDAAIDAVRNCFFDVQNCRDRVNELEDQFSAPGNGSALANGDDGRSLHNKIYDGAVVQVDLAGYTEKVWSVLGHGIDDEIALVTFINQTIKDMIGEAFYSVVPSAVDFTEGLLAGTGDGAILRFTDANAAHQFAIQLRDVASRHNAKIKSPKRDQSHEYVFRIGISYGRVMIRRLPFPLVGIEMAGIPLIESARMESKCQPGSVLVTRLFWERLKKEHQFMYKRIEKIEGKHGEQFDGCHLKRMRLGA